MAFFDELTKKAQLVAGAAAEKAKDLAETATEKAKAATDAAKMNMEILSEQREIEKNYRAIGEWFVSEFQGELPDAVKDVVAAVNASKEKIAQLEAAKRKEETQDEEPQEESGDAKTCSVCGTVSDSNFCPHCGAPHGQVNNRFNRKSTASAVLFFLSPKGKPFGDKRLAVCCAHNLFAESEQIPHVQTEKYFRPGTRPGRK